MAALEIQPEATGRGRTARRARDLAEQMIRLAGKKPGSEIPIVYTGLRSGEKLFEELSTNTEHADKTKHPKVFIGRIRPWCMTHWQRWAMIGGGCLAWPCAHPNWSVPCALKTTTTRLKLPAEPSPGGR